VFIASGQTPIIQGFWGAKKRRLFTERCLLAYEKVSVRTHASVRRFGHN
jgi:hypothetical protein